MARYRFSGRLLVRMPMASCVHRALPFLWPLLGGVALLSSCCSNEIFSKYRWAMFKHLQILVR